MATSRKTIATYRGTGAQKTFAFNYDYLQKAFIKVSVEGVILTYGIDYTVTNRQVDLLVAPAADVLVIVYRETSTGRLVSWEDASVLRAADMTLFEVQLLHIAEETQDKVQDAGMALDPEDSIWDARFHKIKNVKDPTMPEDVVTKRHFDLFKGSLANAQASESAAKVSETNAKTSEDNAKASEVAAKVSETAAKTSETNAKAIENVVVPLVPTLQQASQDAATASAQATQAAADANTALVTVKSLGAVPIGMVVPFLSPTAVPGYLMLSGPNKVSSFDKALYPDLYAYLGTDQLPDFTNRFPQGAGDKIAGGSFKAWRIPSFTVSTTGAHTHTVSTNTTGNHNHAAYASAGWAQAQANGANGLAGYGKGAQIGYTNGVGSQPLIGYEGDHSHTGSASSAGDHTHTVSVPGATNDTYMAPDAVGVYWAIKAYGALATEGAVSAAQLVALCDDRYTKEQADARFSPAGLGYERSAKLLTDLNLDNLVTSGIYMGQNLTAFAGRWTNTDWFWVEVIRHNDNWVYQRLIALGAVFNDLAGRSWTRIKLNGTWQQWKEFGAGVSVLTGVIAHGGTIPLPDGYTQDQCRWMVSVYDDNPTGHIWDIQEVGSNLHYRFQCYANASRGVVCQVFHGNGGTSGTWVASTANYIIIGVKY